MKKVLSWITKNLGIILVVFVVVAFSIGVYLFMNDPKIKFVKLVNKEYKSFTSILDQAKESELAKLSKTDTVTSSGTVNFDFILDNKVFGDTLDPLVSAIDGLSINYQYGSDPQASNTFVKLDSNINSKDFINVDLYQKGDKQYVYLNDIFDKYIESDSTQLINTKSDKTDDTLYLTNKIKTSLYAALKTSDFTTETATIEVNNISIVTNKISLKLTDARMKEISKAVLTDLKNDDKAISIINDLSGNGTDAKKSLERAIASIDDEKALENPLTFDIYVKNDSIARIDVFDGKDKTIEYNSYVDFNPVKEVTVYSANQEFIYAKFEQKSLNDISYEISIGKDVVFANGTIAKAIQENIANKTWNLSTTFNMVLSYENTVLGSIKIDTTSTTKVGEKVTIPSSFDSIKESDLTDKDQEQISNNFIKKFSDLFPEPVETYPDATKNSNVETY